MTLLIGNDECLCVLSLSSRCGQMGVQIGQLLHHGLVAVGLLRVDGLGMLSQVVKTREGLAAVALKRPLASVFADVPSQVFATCECHVAVTEAAALEDGRCLAILLNDFGRAC